LEHVIEDFDINCICSNFNSDIFGVCKSGYVTLNVKYECYVCERFTTAVKFQALTRSEQLSRYITILWTVL